MTQDDPTSSDSQTWGAVALMAVCVATLIASEFMPVSLLTPMAGAALYARELVDNDEIVETPVPSRAVLNNLCGMRDSALDGLGLGFLPKAFVASRIEAAELKAVLPQHSPTFDPYHLFYPGRRQSSLALQALVEALRWRANETSEPS